MNNTIEFRLSKNDTNITSEEATEKIVDIFSEVLYQYILKNGLLKTFDVTTLLKDTSYPKTRKTAEEYYA